MKYNIYLFAIFLFAFIQSHVANGQNGSELSIMMGRVQNFGVDRFGWNVEIDYEASALSTLYPSFSLAFSSLVHDENYIYTLDYNQQNYGSAHLGINKHFFIKNVWQIRLMLRGGAYIFKEVDYNYYSFGYDLRPGFQVKYKIHNKFNISSGIQYQIGLGESDFLFNQNWQFSIGASYQLGKR